MKSLTSRQKNIIQVIKDFSSKNSVPPTITEIADKLDLCPSTVFVHIQALQKKGILSKSSKARSIRLTNGPEQHAFTNPYDLSEFKDFEKPLSGLHKSACFFHVQKPESAFVWKLDETDAQCGLGFQAGDLIRIGTGCPDYLHPDQILVLERNDFVFLAKCHEVNDHYIQLRIGHYPWPEKEKDLLNEPLKIIGVLLGFQRSFE